eukprot:364557-Chlamydomonas_euryale.AAC.35
MAFTPTQDWYTISMRGIDNKTYYMTDLGAPTQLVNWSGCGNTINANHPVSAAADMDPRP